MLVSLVLLWQRDTVIRRVTSKPLGSLAPGYAATPRGYALYAGLVSDVGLVLVAIALEIAWLIIGAIALFIAGSVAVIAGEVATYRALKR